jgi:hypothetical protein
MVKINIHKSARYTGSIFLMLALLWMTISTSFVYFPVAEKNPGNMEQPVKKQSGDQAGNPFSNSTEEKAPSTITITEEYIHHTEHHEHPWFSINKCYGFYSLSAYVAWHGEPLCPPPNA